MLEFKLLNKGGIIKNRRPFYVNGELKFSFKNAPLNSTAIFERCDGESTYRDLHEGLCSIDSDWLNGSMKVTVAVLDGSLREQRWFCEHFYARRCKECEGVLIYPDDTDIQRKIVELQEDVSDLAASNKELSDKYSELEKKLNKLLEGYDII